MFARAAIVGRVARERSEARRNYFQHKRELRKRTPRAPLRQRCFIPVLRGPWITVGSGIFLIIIGSVMCNFAFHAEEYSRPKVNVELDNGSLPEDPSGTEKFKALKSLTFVGPSVMGFGIFIIIIACVILMEKRDHILKEYTDRKLQAQHDIKINLSTNSSIGPSSMPLQCYADFYEAVNRTSPVKELSHKLRAPSSLPCIQSFRHAMHDIVEVERPQVELTSFQLNTSADQPTYTTALHEEQSIISSRNSELYDEKLDTSCLEKEFLVETSKL